MMRKMILMLTALTMLVACGRSGRADASGFTREGELRFVRGDTTLSVIDIEIADDDAQRTRGLMYRERMDEDRGMLFVFPEAGPRRFWMKHTPLSLDMLFVSAEGEILAIVEHTTPYSQKGVNCTQDALYVVEVNAGYTAAHGIRPGDGIEWRFE